MIGGYVMILQMFLMLCTQSFRQLSWFWEWWAMKGTSCTPLLSSRTSDECCCLHWGLEAVVKPWIDSVRGERPYVFQQDSAPSHKAMTTQDWMSENLYNHITPNMWPPGFPDLNPLDYYVWGVVERETNKRPHNTLDSLRAARVMMHIDEDHLIWHANVSGRELKLLLPLKAILSINCIAYESLSLL